MIGYWVLFCALYATCVSSSAARRTPLRRAPSNWPIKTGYVAFGDSYAAGMGTGVTSDDPCRVGSNNFAKLLME